jgi:hypothetical protein
MVWSGISLICKFGPVIFQNIDTCRGNGVTVGCYIKQVLRPHGAIFCGHWNYAFQHDNTRALRDSVKKTWFFLQYNNIEVMSWYGLSPDSNGTSVWWKRFKDGLMKSNRDRQLQLNLAHFSWGLRYVTVFNANGRHKILTFVPHFF